MGWLRRKLGDEAASPALHTHSAGSRLQVKRAGRSGPVGLRARLLLALAYVLVLAVVALEVPLASSVADRIDAEVESQARAQADIVAASVADLLGPGSAREREKLVDAAAESARGRVILGRRERRPLVASEGTPPGRSYAGRPEIATALDGRTDQLERRSEAL